MTTSKPGKIVLKDSYLAMVQNAEGANLFRNLYALVDGEKKDIVENGNLSCALFVSIILHTFRLIEAPHATVSGLERDLIKSLWHKTETPSAGDIIIWEAIRQGDDEAHPHIGFYLGNGEAMSNNWQTRVPARHLYTCGTKPDGTPVRAITAIYTHDFLA